MIFYLVLWPDQPPGRDHRFRKEQDTIIISWHGHSFPVYFHWFCFTLSARRALLADQSCLVLIQISPLIRMKVLTDWTTTLQHSWELNNIIILKVSRVDYPFFFFFGLELVNLTVVPQKTKSKCASTLPSNLPCRLRILNTHNWKTTTIFGKLYTNPIFLLITYKYKLTIFFLKSGYNSK